MSERGSWAAGVGAAGLRAEQAAPAAEQAAPAHPVPDKRAALRRALLADLGVILAKAAVILAVGWAALTFVFGLYRVSDASMEPALRDCDLVLFYRLDQRPTAGELAVFSRDGRATCGRVVARAGDAVDIDEEGLVINGAHQATGVAVGETTQVQDGVTFPLTVGEGQVFVLGDNREEAVDSRIVGCIDEGDLLGTVIGVFRRRNF